MDRYHAGTGYAGPMVNYDDMMSPEAFIRRAVFGRPEPLLCDGQRMDTPFFGRLFDELANAHTAYIKECHTEGSARVFACQLRKELPLEVYEVGVKRKDPQYPGWHIFVYNRIYKWMGAPRWHQEPHPTHMWLDVYEAAKILKVTPGQVRRLALGMGIAVRRTGGRNQMILPRAAVVIMANRPHRWKHRTTQRT